MRLAATLIILAGCGASAKPAAAPAHTESAGDAEDGVGDVLGEVHESLERGDSQGILPLLGAPFTLAGPGPGALFVDKSAAIVALGDAWHNEKKHKLKAHDPEVHVAPGGHAAWAIDQGTLDGATYVATAVLTGADELWVIDAAQIARPVKKTPGGAPAAMTAEVATGAEPLVQLFTEALGGRDAAIEQLDDDAVLVDGAGKIVEGADKIEKRWAPPAEKKHKKKHKKKHHEDEDAADEPPPPPAPATTFTLQGAPRAGLTADGALGWVCADVDVTEPDAVPIPHRFFYVYEKGDQGWHLVALHEATFSP